MGPSPDDTRPSADEALARLIDGNQRLLQGEANSAAFRRETLADLAKGQRPYATILGCSDSACRPSGFSMPAWENCLWCAWPKQVA